MIIISWYTDSDGEGRFDLRSLGRRVGPTAPEFPRAHGRRDEHRSGPIRDGQHFRLWGIIAPKCH